MKVMGADETVLKVKGKRTVVGFVTDAATGQLLGMDVLVERDSEGFIKWLEGYVSRFGVEAMVTDDLSTYKPVVVNQALAGVGTEVGSTRRRRRSFFRRTWTRGGEIHGYLTYLNIR